MVNNMKTQKKIKKFRHIAVGEETFNRFRSLNDKMSDEEVLKKLLEKNEVKE